MQNTFFQSQSCPAVQRRRAALWSWVLAVLLVGMANPQAQDTTPLSVTNELMQADDSGGSDLTQAGEDDTTGTNMVADTNQVATPGPDGRTRRRRRIQNRPRDPLANRDSKFNPGDTNSNPASLDYSAFRLIVERNIFDPNRAPRSVRPTGQPKTTDSFSLVGTMSYEKGIFAFFDGTSSDYKKAVKPDETIADYKVASISSDAVKLAHGTNVLDLAVGAQMRRRDDGTWEKTASPEPYAAASTGTTPSAASGADNDILKKMMMRREKE